jgi:hypothetical protein
MLPKGGHPVRTKLLKMKFIHEGREHEDDEDVFFVSKSGAISPYKPKKPRKRHMTVARAMKQAAKAAGLTVNNVVVKPDGVELRLNEAAPDQPNPWHSI